MIHLNLDLSGMEPLLEMDKAAREEVERAGNQLIAMTRAHIIEEANRKLRSRRQLFVDSLTHFQVDDNTFVVNLDGAARWIDEGLSEHNMLADLLGSPKAKRAADGSSYVVVPFEHNKGAAVITPAQASLLATIKTAMKQAQIPFGKIEKGEQGQPLQGVLHNLRVPTPKRTGQGPGQGHGPLGAPIQGWSADGQSGTPILQGLQVHQRTTKDKKGHDATRRSIMTFRVASSKHEKDGGRWDHPGVPPTNLMDEGADWALEQWEKTIAPQLVENLYMRLG